MQRTSCKKDCKYQLLYQQALARRSHYLNVINGLSILLSFDNIIDEGLPGWPKMREARAKKNIEQHIHAYRKANKSIKHLRIILTEGCADCQIDLPEVDAQETIARAAEEAVKNFGKFLNGDTVTEVLEVLEDIK